MCNRYTWPWCTYESALDCNLWCRVQENRAHFIHAILFCHYVFSFGKTKKPLIQKCIYSLASSAVKWCWSLSLFSLLLISNCSNKIYPLTVPSEAEVSLSWAVSCHPVHAFSTSPYVVMKLIEQTTYSTSSDLVPAYAVGLIHLVCAARWPTSMGTQFSSAHAVHVVWYSCGYWRAAQVVCYTAKARKNHDCKCLFEPEKAMNGHPF